jgi:hypothetical protein
MPKIRKDNLTPEQKRAVLALTREGVGLSRIALEIRKSRTAVANYLRECGLYRPRTIRLHVDSLSRRERAKLLELNARGLSYRAISEALGFNDWQQARNTIKRLGALELRHVIVHARGARRCYVCEKVKAIADFARGYRCRDCDWFYMADYKYGLTKPEALALLRKQRGVCAICKQRCADRANLCVDHDRDTHSIRGLLCMRCNSGIGDFAHNARILENAIAYLSQPRTAHVYCSDFGRLARTRPWREELRRSQDNRCAICKTGAKLGVDHDHATMLVRGLLCRPCNLGLGLMNNDRKRLRAAVRYLERATEPRHTSSSVSPRRSRRGASARRAAAT